MKKNLLPFVMFLLFAGMFTKANAGEVSGGSFSFSENILTLYNSGTIVITYDPNSNSLASESDMYLHLWYKYKWCDNQSAGDQQIPLGEWGDNKHRMTKGEDGKFRLTITGTLADYIQAKSSVSDLGSSGASNCPVFLCCIAKTTDGGSQSQEGGVGVSNYYKLDFYPENQEARKESNIYYYYVGETFQYKIEKFLKWNGSESKTDDKKYVVRLLADDTKIDSIPETATYGNGEYVQSYIWQTAGTAMTLSAQSVTGSNEKATQTYQITVANPTVTLTIDSANNQVTEGNNLKVTATVPVPAIADLTVTLSGISEFTGTQTIIISAGSTSAYTTLTANDDHAKAGNKNVSIGVSGVTGLENINFTLAEAISITVLDKDANCSNPAEPTVTAEAVCMESAAAVITVTNHNTYTSPLYSLWTEVSGGSQVGSDNTAGSITVSETFNEAKTYYLQVRETNAPAGCDISDRATVAVNIKEKPSDFSTNVTNATNGEQDGKIRFTAGIKGVKPFTIVLTSSSKGINMTGYISGGHGDTTFTDLPPADDYQAVITGADGCGDVTISNIAIAELACTPPADPAVSGGAQNICKGTGTTLTIENYATGVTYTLHNSANASVATNSGSSVTVPNDLPAGNYTLQGSGYSGPGECETSSQISALTVKPVPSEAVAAVVQESSPVTDLGKISVTTGTLGGSPFTVTLKKSGVDDMVANNITNSHNFENLSAGSYSVVVTASNGCDTTIDNLTIVNCTPPAKPNVSDVSICPSTQASITISGYDNNIFTYSLYNEANDAAIGSAVYEDGVLTTPELSANTNYTVRATLKAEALEGCKYSSKGVTVTINELPAVTLTPGPVTCADSGSIEVTVSGGQSYQDSKYDIRLNGSTDENKQNSGYIYRDLDVATYTVKVIDKNGCFTTEQTTVSRDKTAPEITPEVTPSSAANNDGSIYVTLKNAVQVSLNVDPQNPQTAPHTFQNLACGIYTLSATYDVTGCESTIQVKLSTSAPRMTLLPAWQVQGDSLTITLNTSSSSIQNTDFKFYNNDDLYVWGGVVFEDDNSKYVNSGVWGDIPEDKFKMTKVTDYLYTYTIKDMSSLYELNGNDYLSQGWGLLKDVKGYKWLFRTAGDGSGNNILQEKKNGSDDFYEDIHSFSVRVWATDVNERTNKDGYYQYYQGEKVKLLIEKKVDDILNDSKKYPVEIKIGETSLLTLDKNVIYDGEADGKLDTVLTLSAMLKDVLRAYGYSEGGAVANSTNEYEHKIEVIEPVITLTQSTATADETDNCTDTISATIPANYKQQIKIAVSVSGGTKGMDYNLSYDTIIIPAGQKSGYAVLTVLPDGLYTDRGNLEITSDGVVSGDVEFSVTGGPLTLTVGNSEIPPAPVITSLVPVNDENVIKNEVVTIKVKANNTDTVYLYINGTLSETTIADTLWYDYTPATVKADTISVIAKNRYGLQATLVHIINITECSPNPTPAISTIAPVSYSCGSVSFTITNYGGTQVYTLWTEAENGSNVTSLMQGEADEKTVSMQFTKDTAFYLQAYDDSKYDECKISARTAVSIEVRDEPSIVQTTPAADIILKKDSVLNLEAVGNETVDSIFIYVNNQRVKSAKSTSITDGFSSDTIGLFAVRFVAKNDIGYEVEKRVNISVYDPNAAGVTVSDGIDIAVLDDSITIVLNTSAMGLTEGENLYLHPFYKYKQNEGDPGDQIIVPCDWGSKCYPMTCSSGGIYTIQTSSLGSMFNLTGSDAWKGDRPTGMGFVFYNEDGLREIKNDGGDFWLPLKADYAVKLWIDNQEDHKTDGIYNYYAGEKVNLKVEKYLKYNTIWSLDADNIKKYPINVLVDGSVKKTILAAETYTNGAVYLSLPLTESIEISAKGISNVSEREAEQKYNVAVHAPVITLTQSTATANEADNRTDTIKATIPANYKQQIKIAVSVSGGTKDTDYALSDDTIIIPVGQTSGYTVLTVLPDGLYTGRGDLEITSDGVVSGDIQFSVTGSPLTLEVENSEVVPVPEIVSLVPVNGENVKKNETLTVKVKANNTDTVYLYINGTLSKTTIADTLWHDYTPLTVQSDTIFVIAKNRHGLQVTRTNIINVTECSPNPAPAISTIAPVSYSSNSVSFTIINYDGTQVYTLWTEADGGTDVTSLMQGEAGEKTVSMQFTKDTAFYLQAYDDSRDDECKTSVRTVVSITVKSKPSIVQTTPAADIVLKKDSVLNLHAEGNETVDSIFIYVDGQRVKSAKSTSITDGFSSDTIGLFEVRFVAKNDIGYEVEKRVNISVYDPNAAGVTISDGIDIAVLDDSITIVLNTSAMGLTAGENLYLHPFYKYKQNVGDMNDQETVPCAWQGKCYPMTYNGGIYTFKTSSLRSFFDISGNKGDCPVGMGFVFYNEDGSREIKNNGGDFWLPLKADYAVKLWIDNQEDHKTDGIYNYYAGEDVNLKVEKYLKYNTQWSLDADNIKKYPIDILVDGLVEETILAAETYTNGAVYLSLPLTESIEISAKGISNVSEREAEQKYGVVVHTPVVTLTQSTDSVGEGEGSDTVWATIPRAYANDIKIAVDVSGGAHELSYDTLTIFSGSTNGYVVVEALKDGVNEQRTPLIITASVKPDSKVAFTVEGSPLTLKVGNTDLSVGNEILKAETLKIYPNPVANGILTVETSLPSGTPVSITNVVGRRVIEARIHGSETIIDLRSLSGGIYMLKAGSRVEKFVVRN